MSYKKSYKIVVIFLSVLCILFNFGFYSNAEAIEKTVNSLVEYQTHVQDYRMAAMG